MEEMAHLPRSIKRIWALSAIGSLILGLVITGGLWLAANHWHWPNWLVVVGLILTVGEVIVELLAVPYRYHFTGYRVTDKAVEITSGWVIRKQIAIPVARIQNVTLKAGPLMQSAKLEEVVIATAADSYDIEGVTPDVAAQLRDAIMTRALEVRDEL